MSPWDFEDRRCKDEDVRHFYPRGGDESDRNVPAREYQYAKRICSMCRHIKACAAYGVENEQYGVWGGLSPKDRTVIRNKLTLNCP